MLERPDLSDEIIIACMQAEYGLHHILQVVFLPLGADQNTAVYRVVVDDQTQYFLKLRTGVFDEISVVLPKFLHNRGIMQIIPPMANTTGQLWGYLDSFKMILYPYMEGRDGYEVRLSERQWVEFGKALKGIHAATVPQKLVSRIQREIYSPQWREKVSIFLSQIEHRDFDDPIAVELAAFLRAKRAGILDLVGRAEQLAQALQAQTQEYILCHADLHAGNLLMDAQGAFYIVDWDDPLLAPKERDLMFIGGALMGGWCTPQEEETLFYQGYGQTQIDPSALTYYRYERIIQDIAAFCEQIIMTEAGGEDREQALRYLKSNFLPEGTIAIARKSDQTLR